MAPITVNNNTIDPAKPNAPSLPKDAKDTKFILLKCKHRLSPAEIDQAVAQKVEIQRLVEETTYLCRYEPDDLITLKTKLVFVDEALVYANDFVISPAVKAALGQKEDPKALLAFTVVLHQSTKETGADLFKEVQKLSAAATMIDFNAHQLRARMPRSILPAVAKIDCVETIEETKVVQLLDAKASKVVKTGNGWKYSTDFQGSGEIIAIADRGFDNGTAADVHPAFITRNMLFKDENRVIAVVDAGLGPDVHELDLKMDRGHLSPLRDLWGHGTHVAGCALGELDDSKNSRDKDDPYCVNRIQAPAPKAKLYFQAIAGGEGVIPNLDSLFVQPVNAPFKIHSNSWSGRSVRENQPQETYTNAESARVDNAMHTNRELLIVWSAGNDGTKWLKFHDQPVYRQIGDFTAAKNALVVGATYNDRYMVPGDTDISTDGQIKPDEGVMMASSVCADFSTKGPTTDMRLKPDVVAPGAGVLSARTRSAKKNQLGIFAFGECENPNFSFMTGTSHSAPIVAGCAAALREALKKYGNAQPSGALVKALLVNGAVDLGGQQYIYNVVHQEPAEEVNSDAKTVIEREIEQSENINEAGPSEAKPVQMISKTTKVQMEMPHAPNPIQGFGMIDLQRSLLCVAPKVAKAGGALDVAAVVVTDADHPPWTLQLDVPKGLPVLRVTLAWTDPPGNIMQDELYLSVESRNQSGNTVAIQHPDSPNTPAYENAAAAPLPVYTKNNLQKVTWNPNQPKVIISVTAVTLAVNSQRAFSIAYFFNAN